MTQFTGDDPLNVTDPLGLKGWYCINGQSHYYTGNKYGKVGNGKCASQPKKSAPSQRVQRAGIAALGFAGSSAGAASAVNDASGTASHLSDDALLGDALWGVRYANAAHAFAGAGLLLTVSSDLQSHHSVGYTVGDAGGGLGGALAGGFVAAAACGAPEDVVGVACSVGGGAVGGWLGSNVLSQVFSNLQKGLEGNG